LEIIREIELFLLTSLKESTISSLSFVLGSVAPFT